MCCRGLLSLVNDVVEYLFDPCMSTEDIDSTTNGYFHYFVLY